MKKICFLLLSFIISGFLQAQDVSTINFTFNHIALSVKDVDRSADFYKKVLNLNEITNKTKIDGIRWLSLGEGKELHLISILKEDVSINKALHFALTTSDFDSFIKVLDEMKISYSDWPGTTQKINIRADGIKQIFFQDPDGYWIEVNSVVQK
jgi:catechol 2,3-dioxygenase-like lactoylglutathione lyase family enzyme